MRGDFFERILYYMYLSIVKLPYLSSEEAVHASLLTCFGCTREEGKILYQKQETCTGDGLNLILLTQSQKKPVSSQTAEVLQCVEKKPPFKKGQVYKFKALLRPIKKDKSTGKKVTYSSQELRESWVRRKLSKGGTDVLLIAEKNYQFFSFKEATVTAFLYEGVISVSDPTIFKKKYVEGIGQSKAYGCGMLWLERIA